MAIIRAKNEADYTFKAGSYGVDRLRVVQFLGTEGISELFHFSIDLASTDGGIDFEKVVGQPALLTIIGPKGKRFIHGLVNLFEQVGKDGIWTLYRADVVPAVWILSQRVTCRIFQNQSIPEIIKKVLTDAGIASDQFRLSLKKSYNPLDYCVQYRESDLAFIARLMEQHGIFYFFEHAAEKHVMVMGDDHVVHVSIAEPAKVIYRTPGTAGVSDQEHVYEYRFHREVRTGAVRLRDFDFKRPRLHLEQEAKAKGDGKLEAYDYPGEYLTSVEGKDLAKVRLEELQSTHLIGSGQSDCRRFIPGYLFTLERYDRSELNREYLLTRVSQSGGQPQALGAEAAGGDEEAAYQNQFDCIPSDVSFRPLRITPRPIVQGPQTAIVVGPKGEEIYTDEYGRVKVQFHWDREGKQDEKSSCWIRVSQSWAGARWGAMFIPRIGQEVIVEFLEGDPDRPIITGRVYNGDNKPPYELPHEKTKSTIKSNTSKGGGGCNEVLFEDMKGSEFIKVSSVGNKSYLSLGIQQSHGEEHSPDGTVLATQKGVSINAGEGVHIAAGASEHDEGAKSAKMTADEIQKGIATAAAIIATASGAVAEKVATSHIPITSLIAEIAGIVAGLTLPSAYLTAPGKVACLAGGEVVIGAGLVLDCFAVGPANLMSAKSVLVAGGFGTSIVAGHGDVEAISISKDVKIHSKKEDVKLEAKKSINLKAEENNIHGNAEHAIEFIADKDDVTLQAMEANVELLAKKNIKETADEEINLVSGSSSVVMKKDGKIEISGTDITIKTSSGQINIDAGGIITIKGSMVKINS